MPTKVLLLDDEPDNLLLLRTTIARSSYGEQVQCISFRSGQDALAWCMENTVDLCIVDYNMPGMNGLEFIEAVRQIESYQYVPIAVFSAHMEEAFHVRIRRGGADDLIEKPADFIALRKRIHAYLELHHRYLKYSKHLETLSEGKCIPGVLKQNDREKVVRQLGLAFMKAQEGDEHSLRVARLAEMIARNMGMDSEYCEKIFFNTPFHDIGRNLLPAHYWDDAFGSTGENTGYLPLHTIMGSKLIAASKLKDSEMAAEIAMSHHEQVNGRGYPYALSGDDIPMAARIVSVADNLDRLLSGQADNYVGISVGAAVRKLKSMVGNELDPECVAALGGNEKSIAEILTMPVSQTQGVALV